MPSISQLLFELKYRLQKTVHPLHAVSIEVTGRCNLTCLHCYAEAGNKPEMSLEDISRLAADLHRAFRPPLHICLTGGEPLLRKDIVDVVDCFKSKGYSVSVVTNGTLLTRCLAEAFGTRLTGISVSLDGLTKAHNHLRGGDVFDHALAAIKLLKAAHVPYIGIKTTVYRGNLADIDQLYELVLSLGVDLWHVFAVEPHGRAADNPELLLTQSEYAQLRDKLSLLARDKKLRIQFGEEMVRSSSCSACTLKRCTAGITQMAVLNDGSVSSCINATRDTVPEGNVFSENIGQIWEDGFKRNREKVYRQCGGHHYERPACG